MNRGLLALAAVGLAWVTLNVLAADRSGVASATANFHVFNGRNAPSATAYAVVDYSRDADKWVITGAVTGAWPGTYTLSLGTSGTCEGNYAIVTFTTNADGYARFQAEVPNSERFPADYNIARIQSAGNPCVSELVATAANGSLVY